MKFSKEYSKLKYPIFTTIRQDKGYYNLGQIINVETPEQVFKAEVVSLRKMTTNDLTVTMALRDADCSVQSLEELFKRFYKDNVGPLVLITLMKV